MVRFSICSGGFMMYIKLRLPSGANDDRTDGGCAMALMANPTP
jgi:hypothetical protein